MRRKQRVMVEVTFSCDVTGKDAKNVVRAIIESGDFGKAECDALPRSSAIIQKITCKEGQRVLTAN